MLKRVQVKFVGHACVLVSFENASILLDPWLGEPINDGIFHAHPPPLALTEEELSSVVAIHISHGHSDHFAPESLRGISKKIPVIIAQYSHKTLLKQIQEIGFQVIEVPTGKSQLQVGPFRLSVFPVTPEDFAGNSSAIIEVSGERYYFANDCAHNPGYYYFLNHLFGKFDGAFVGIATLNPVNWLFDFSMCKEMIKPMTMEESAIFRQNQAWDHLVLLCQILKPNWVVPYASNIRFLNRDYSKLNKFFAEPEDIFRLTFAETQPVVLYPGDNITRDARVEKSHSNLRTTEVSAEILRPERFSDTRSDLDRSIWHQKVNEFFLQGFQFASKSWSAPMKILFKLTYRDQTTEFFITFDCQAWTAEHEQTVKQDQREEADMIITCPESVVDYALEKGYSFSRFVFLYAIEVKIIHLKFNQLRIWG